MVSKHDYPTHHLSSIFYLYPYWHLSNKRRTHLKMTITYSIWQGSKLLSIDNIATDIKEVEHLIDSLNASTLAKTKKFNANIMSIKAGK